VSIKGSFKSYIGWPWKEYLRMVIMKIDINEFIDLKGWNEWANGFLETLFYGEYPNLGPEAAMVRRVNLTSFHVLKSSQETELFFMRRFAQ